jgi:hypothetical protein
VTKLLKCDLNKREELMHFQSGVLLVLVVEQVGHESLVVRQVFTQRYGDRLAVTLGTLTAGRNTPAVSRVYSGIVQTSLINVMKALVETKSGYIPTRHMQA